MYSLNDMAKRLGVLVLALLAGAVQGLTFPEKVIWLHAPIAGISSDGVTVYTNSTGVYNFKRETNVGVFDTYNAVTGRIKPISEDGKPFSQKYYNDSAKDPNRTTSPRNLFFANSVRTGKPFFSDLVKNIELGEQFRYFYSIYTANKKYIVMSASGSVGIREAKSLKLIAFIDYCPWESETNPCSDSKAIVNKKMNRLFLVYNYGISAFYKIDFSHLPKSTEEFEKSKIPIPPEPDTQLHGINPSVLSASPDGTMFFTGSVRDFDTGKILYTVKPPYPTRSIFSEDSKYLAVTGDFVSLINARTGKIYKTYRGVASGPFFTKNNKMLFSDLKSNLHIVSLP